LNNAVTKYRIPPENIYNIDEKGFLIGKANKSKRVISVKSISTIKKTKAYQDGNREFITLIATIVADGSILPPTLIYTGGSADFQLSWLQDYEALDSQAYFGSSENGWSSNAFGLKWLSTVFIPNIQQNRGYKLLIVDGHSSHVNLAFLEACANEKIIVLILPPHTTHDLQPLDVGLFSPLSQSYSSQLHKLMAESMGLVSITKSRFWPLFKYAWESAFTTSNIQSAFKKSGIWPIDSNLILHELFEDDKWVSEAESIDFQPYLKTPKTSNDLRNLQRKYRNNISTEIGAKLFKTNLELLAENSILKHENRGLKSVLKLAKRNYKRSKLDLTGEPIKGAQLYDTDQVLKARQYYQQIEQDKIDKKEQIRLKKLQKDQEKAALKLEKQAKALAKKTEAIRKREDAQINKELQAQIRAENRAHKAKQKIPKRPPKVLKSSINTPKKATQTSQGLKSPIKKKVKKVRSVHTSTGGVDTIQQVVSRRGRVIQQPRRFLV
jgi:DDE superfamily endonuclease